jgi:phosphoribosylaminoimidazole (AIR) synthetase
MVVCVRPDEQVQTLKILEQLGETAYVIGKIEKNDQSEPYVMLV